MGVLPVTIIPADCKGFTAALFTRNVAGDTEREVPRERSIQRLMGPGLMIRR